ncbi:MAG: hypothetical protein P8I97_10995 [Verrucomicrobiales bacterium]|jgi:hypothetical protein|nr:hypothetical protein [Verrucomicrobiales bacterium]
MKPKTKKYLFRSITLVIVAVVGLVLLDRWDKAKNRGYEFGYYGVFNRITHSLESIPDVSGVTTTAMNIDISLEEFGLDVILKDGRTIKLFFQERDPIRSLSGQKLRTALEGLFEAQEINSNSEQKDLPPTNNK